MVGGETATFDSVKPLFDMMGKNVTLIGAVGAGQVCKVANQVIVAATIEAVGEALLLASKAGVDPARVREALMGGFASSRILEVHGERMTKRTFNPGFRIELHQKDLNLALVDRAGARRGAAEHGHLPGAVQRVRRRTAAKHGTIRRWCARSKSRQSRDRPAGEVNRRRRALTNHECPPPGSPCPHREAWAKPISSPGCNIPALLSPADASIRARRFVRAHRNDGHVRPPCRRPGLMHQGSCMLRAA